MSSEIIRGIIHTPIRATQNSQNSQIFTGFAYENYDKKLPYSCDILTGNLVVDVIAGILHLSSKQTYKTPKQGVIMKLFTPFDIRFPPFLVKTKRHEMHDYYTIVKIENDKDSNIYGTVLQYIGKVSEIDINPSQIATCHWSKKIDRDIQKYCSIDIVDRRCILSTDIDSLVLSIDPSGCKDIDDALQCIQHDDYIEIRVHIADVSSYIPEGSELDIELSRRIESLYFHDKTINMIPDTLAVGECSLIEGSNKRTHTMIAILKTDTTIDNIEYKFVRTNTYIDKNMTYEDVDKIISNNYKSKLCDNIRLLYEIGNQIGKLLRIESNDYDSHVMVANFMILTNVLASSALKKYNGSLIRSHKTPIDNVSIPSPATKLRSIHENIRLDRAVYVLDTPEYDNSHYGLKVSRYTHFTSPIRRYADIVVHRMIANVDDGSRADIKKLTPIVFRMNHYKKLYRDMMYIDSIIRYVDDVYETTGYIVYITQNSLKIYIDELDAIVSVELLSDKLKKLIETTTNNELIKISYNDNIWELYLYQNVELKLYRLRNGTKFFKTVITKPFLMDVFA